MLLLFLTCISVSSESSSSSSLFFLSPITKHDTQTNAPDQTLYIYIYNKQQHSCFSSDIYAPTTLILLHSVRSIPHSTDGGCTLPQTITPPPTTTLFAPPLTPHRPPLDSRNPRLPPPMARRGHRPRHPLVTRSRSVPRHGHHHHHHSLPPLLRLRQEPSLPITQPFLPLLPRLDLRFLL